jgi:hypothetical protein
MKITYIVFFFLFSFSANSKEMKCHFEEVYIDGSEQRGFLLINNKMLRYQYYDKQLFTLIRNNDLNFVIRNDNPSIVQKIDEKNQILLSNLIKLFLSSQIKNTEYQDQELIIKAQTSEEFEFYKRISIQNNDIVLSVYFYNCKTTILNEKFFNPTPLIDFFY